MESEADFPSKLSLYTIGGADNMPMWLIQKVWAQRPEIGKLVILDVKPSFGPDGGAGGTNPASRHVPELRMIQTPIYVARIDYRKTGLDMLVDCKPVNPSAEASPMTPYIPDADIIMVGVPEEQIQLVAETILAQASPGTYVFDICSTKGPVLDTLVDNSPEGVTVLGLHPNFGPAVPGLSGQTVVMCSTSRRDGAFYGWMEEVFRSGGATVQWVDPNEHDDYMLVVQTLTHFSYMAIGKTLANMAKKGFSLEESFRFATPPYGILIAVMSRIIGSNPRLYAQIQDQRGAKETRAMFLEAVTELQESFLGSRDDIRDTITDIVAPFRGTEIARAFAHSKHLVSSTQDMFRNLFDRSQTGKLTILLVGDPMDSASPSRIHVGKVREVDGDSVVLTEGHLKIKGKSYIAYDEESSTGIRKLGISIPERVSRIRRHNIRAVFSDAETLAWRKGNLEHHKRDIPVLASEEVDLEVICSDLSRLIDPVVSGEPLDTVNAQWLTGYGFSNKILRFSVFGDRDPDFAELAIRQKLERFGIRVQSHRNSRKNDFSEDGT